MHTHAYYYMFGICKPFKNNLQYNIVKYFMNDNDFINYGIN